MGADDDGRDGEQHDIAGAVASCAASHRSLHEHLASLSDIDPSEPSRLPDWTIGHVLTHIARNGDSHLDMLAGRPQYPSAEVRNGDIAAGASRPWVDLIDDVRQSCTAVDEAFAGFDDWDRAVTTFGGERPARMLLLLRQREVEIHRVDLGLGAEFDDLPSDYVRRELRVLTMLWTARQPMGLTRLPDAVLASSPSDRLAWFFGRVEIEGAAAAGIF